MNAGAKKEPKTVAGAANRGVPLAAPEASALPESDFTATPTACLRPLPNR